MIDHKIVHSAVKPDAIKIDNYSVWVSTNIKQIEVKDESDTHIEYEYHLIQYGKDEFIIDSDAQLRADVDFISIMTGVDL